MSIPTDLNDTTEVRSALEAIVAEMRSEARLDSSGVFTIDASLALDKMRRFQVERPQDFVLWLGAAAVAGGASQLLVTIGINQVCVEFDGTPFDSQELKQVVEESGSSQPGRLGHLGFALTAALATGPDEIVIESADWRLQVTPGTTRLSRVLDGALERVRFLLVRQRSRAEDWEFEQFNYLRERIPQTLLKISVNRRQDVGYRMPSDILHGQHYWQGTDGSTLMARLVSNESCRRREHQRNFSVLLALDSWHRESPAQIFFLYDGLLMPMKLEFPFCFQAVVAWPPVGLNLSRTAIIETAEQQQVVEVVKQLALGLAGDFLRNYAELKPGLRHLAQPWLASLADSNSSLASECRGLLRTYHADGVWLERDDPGVMVKELLQNFIEPQSPPLKDRPPTPGRRGFWACLEAMFNPAAFEPHPDQVVSLREGMNERKKWRSLLAGLLSVFDPQSTLRLGLSAAVADPEWLVLEGILPDGTHVLLRAEGSSVTIRCFYNRDWLARATASPVVVPQGWQGEASGETVLFRGGRWKEPESLVSLLRAVLDSRRQAQSLELLKCPGCLSQMDKVVLDVVLDRCRHCRTLWLDYAELEWLLKARPDLAFQAPPEGGACPRCLVRLQPQLRGNRCGSECPKCRGFWLLLGSEL